MSCELSVHLHGSLPPYAHIYPDRVSHGTLSSESGSAHHETSLTRASAPGCRCKSNHNKDVHLLYPESESLMENLLDPDPSGHHVAILMSLVPTALPAPYTNPALSDVAPWIETSAYRLLDLTLTYGQLVMSPGS